EAQLAAEEAVKVPLDEAGTEGLAVGAAVGGEQAADGDAQLRAHARVVEALWVLRAVGAPLEQVGAQALEGDALLFIDGVDLARGAAAAGVDALGVLLGGVGVAAQARGVQRGREGLGGAAHGGLGVPLEEEVLRAEEEEARAWVAAAA